MQTMKARLLLARNINAVLQARHEDQSGLARWCHKKPSWINKILAGTRPLHIDDFDRVADYLGLSVYQLFQPGISGLTERRKSGDRRAQRDRRRGHVERMIVISDPQPQVAAHAANGKWTAATADRIAVIAQEYADRISAVLAEADPRGQTPRAGAKKSAPRALRRVISGSDPKNAG